MKRQNMLFLITLMAVGFVMGCFLSTSPGTNEAVAADEIEAVNEVIDKFQLAYSSKKITDVQNLFHHKAVVGIDFNNHTSQDIMTLAEWIISTKEIFKNTPMVSDNLTNREIEVYENSMAVVVCDYDYKDPANHQVGKDIFTLMKIKKEWKIVSLIFSGDSV